MNRHRGEVDKAKRDFDNMREQLQWHLNVVDNHLPPQVRERLEVKLKAAADMRLDLGEGRVSSKSCGTASRSRWMTRKKTAYVIESRMISNQERWPCTTGR